MAERNGHPERNEWEEPIRRLLREIETLRRMLDRAEERTDRIAQDLAGLLRFAERSCQPTTGAKPAPRHPHTETAFLLKIAAESGVQSLQIDWRDAAGASARVDGGKPFRLSPTLAHLLATLSAETSKPDGQLVSWKAFNDVAAQLQKKTGRSYTTHAMHQLVSRLRSALAVGGGLNPYLVQTHPLFGLRFAVRSQSRPKVG